MARPRKVEEAPDERDINGVLKALDSDEGITVKFWRVVPGQPNSWLANLALADVGGAASIEQFIAQKWGPSRYFVRVWQDATQKWLISKTIVISQIAAKDAGFDDAENNNGVEYMMPQQHDNSDKLIAILTASADRQAAMAQQNSTMQMQMMQGIFTVVAAMATGGPKFDPMAIIAAMKGGNGGGGVEQVAMMREMFGLVKEFGGTGGSGESDPLMTLATSVLPLIAGRRQAQIENPAEARPAGAAPVQQQQVAKKTAEEEAVFERQRKTFEFILTLKEKAKSGKSVVFWADYIAENETDPGPAAILAALDSGATCDAIIVDLVTFDPELGQEPCRSWLQKLYEELKSGEPGEEGEEKK